MVTQAQADRMNAQTKRQRESLSSLNDSNIIVRDQATKTIINTSNKLNSLIGRIITPAQSNRITRGDYKITPSGIKTGNTMFLKTPLSVRGQDISPQLAKNIALRNQVVSREADKLGAVINARGYASERDKRLANILANAKIENERQINKYNDAIKKEQITKEIELIKEQKTKQETKPKIETLTSLQINNIKKNIPVVELTKNLKTQINIPTVMKFSNNQQLINEYNERETKKFENKPLLWHMGNIAKELGISYTVGHIKGLSQPIYEFTGYPKPSKNEINKAKKPTKYEMPLFWQKAGLNPKVWDRIYQPNYKQYTTLKDKDIQTAVFIDLLLAGNKFIPQLKTGNLQPKALFDLSMATMGLQSINKAITNPSKRNTAEALIMSPMVLNFLKVSKNMFPEGSYIPKLKTKTVEFVTKTIPKGLREIYERGDFTKEEPITIESLKPTNKPFEWLRDEKPLIKTKGKQIFEDPFTGKIRSDLTLKQLKEAQQITKDLLKEGWVPKNAKAIEQANIQKLKDLRSPIKQSPNMKYLVESGFKNNPLIGQKKLWDWYQKNYETVRRTTVLRKKLNEFNEKIHQNTFKNNRKYFENKEYPYKYDNKKFATRKELINYLRANNEIKPSLIENLRTKKEVLNYEKYIDQSNKNKLKIQQEKYKQKPIKEKFLTVEEINSIRRKAKSLEENKKYELSKKGRKAFRKSLLNQRNSKLKQDPSLTREDILIKNLNTYRRKLIKGQKIKKIDYDNINSGLRKYKDRWTRKDKRLKKPSKQELKKGEIAVGEKQQLLLKTKQKTKNKSKPLTKQSQRQLLTGIITTSPKLGQISISKVKQSQTQAQDQKEGQKIDEITSIKPITIQIPKYKMLNRTNQIIIPDEIIENPVIETITINGNLPNNRLMKFPNPIGNDIAYLPIISNDIERIKINKKFLTKQQAEQLGMYLTDITNAYKVNTKKVKVTKNSRLTRPIKWSKPYKFTKKGKTITEKSKFRNDTKFEWKSLMNRPKAYTY